MIIYGIIHLLKHEMRPLWVNIRLLAKNSQEPNIIDLRIIYFPTFIVTALESSIVFQFRQNKE